MKLGHQQPDAGAVTETPRYKGFLAGLALSFACALASPQARAIDSWIVIDANTDTVISEQNPDRLLHPASMTKLMTLYMVFEALDQGRLTLQSTFPVSALAEAQEPTKLNLAKGQRIRVEDAILGLVTLSANDAAVVLAEGLGGSQDRFAQLMTRKAHQIGMVNSNFRNPNGLPDPGQISTARDMAILSRALIRQFPQYYHYFSIREFTYNGVEYANHNHLMSRYEGMDGLKTGFIRASGFNLAASAVRNGRRLIGVVFGGTSAVQRDDFLAGLLDDGFRLSSRVAMTVGPPPPIPGHKPGSVIATDSQTTTAAAATVTRSDGIGALAAAATGQGDSETPGDATIVPPTRVAALPRLPAQHEPSAVLSGQWSIQVGAFKTRAATERAIHQAVQRAPELLRNATSVVLELPHRKGSALYRGRLTGLRASEAQQACRMITNCQTVPPGAS